MTIIKTSNGTGQTLKILKCGLKFSWDGFFVLDILISWFIPTKQLLKSRKGSDCKLEVFSQTRILDIQLSHKSYSFMWVIYGAKQVETGQLDDHQIQCCCDISTGF